MAATMVDSVFLRDKWLVGIGVIFFLSSAVVLAVNKRQREAVLEKLHFRHRRSSGASTPPRSFSPNAKPSTVTNPDFYSTFPPSRRCVLPQLAAKASASNSKILIGTEPSVDFLLEDPLPTTRSYGIENEVPKYTPTGFSTAEIESMGDFPAYDVLSGVPLPEPYDQFDSTKALPRPYRPFRWAYHQTMCKTRLWYRLTASLITHSINENGAQLVARG